MPLTKTIVPTIAMITLLFILLSFGLKCLLFTRCVLYYGGFIVLPFRVSIEHSSCQTGFEQHDRSAVIIFHLCL